MQQIHEAQKHLVEPNQLASNQTIVVDVEYQKSEGYEAGSSYESQNFDRNQATDE